MPRSQTSSLVLIAALVSATLPAPAQQALSPAAQRLRKDVVFLADDEREGRTPGTRGIEQAAEYIAQAFSEIGLKPAPGADGYFQPFSVQGQPYLADSFHVIASVKDGQAIQAESAVDASALAIGGSGTLDDLTVVFVGYGITAKEERRLLDYDDYEGIDVKGKAVLLLRRAPRIDVEGSPFAPGATGVPNQFATFAHKATNAFAHGAKAVLCVNDSGSVMEGMDDLLEFDAAGLRRFSTVPFLTVSRDFANRLLIAGGLPPLKALENGINAELKPRSQVLQGVALDGKVEVLRRQVPTRNVVGVLEGSGPLADETIIVGAHYDHVGRNEFGGSLSGSREIHNGADDNASGTSLMIELARRLARRADPLPRRVVFLAFSGEEEGLLGSAHYVKNPLYPIEKSVYMINFDMVGRLGESNALHVYGAWTTPGMEDLVEALGASNGFDTRMVAGTGRMFFSSDHASFFQAGLPILFFFTDLHPDYHRPSDDSDKVNYAGMARIADLGELVLLDVARRPTRPEFNKQPQPRLARTEPTPKPAQPAAEARDPHAAVTATPATPGAEPGGVVSSAYLGSMPDYGDENADQSQGVRLGGVMPGSPAEKAGLKKGDVVIKFAGKPVGTLQDYTEYLRTAKPGDEVEIVVRREGRETKLKAVLGVRGSAAKQ
jgi:hypothetical protein